MFDEVLKRVRFEAELLVVVVSFSVVSSSFLITDVGISLAMEQYSWALMAFRIFELVFAVLWLAFSAKMAREIARLRRKLYGISFLDKPTRLEEQKKGIATESVRDMLVFYRCYYRRVTAVLVLAIAVGLSILLSAAFLLFYGNMSIWVAIFRWGVNSSMLLIASLLYIHVRKTWGRKLLKVEDAEKKFSEVLGGPIEA